MHQFFLQQAVDLASANVANKGGPFAALIVKNNKIIATHTNRVTENHDPTAHAEMMAIRDACSKLKTFQLTDCILYTSCEPCPMCLGAIYWARLAEVYYASTRYQAAAAGFDDSFIYDEIAKSPAERKIPMHHLKLQLPDQPFMDWDLLAEKVRY